MPIIWYSLSERGNSLQLKRLVQDGLRLVPLLYFGFKQHLFCVKHSASAKRILIPYQPGPQSQFIPVLPFLECRQCHWSFGHCQFCHACEVCSVEHWWQACPYQSTQLECWSWSPNPSTEKMSVVLILGSPHHYFNCVYSSSGSGSQAVVSCSSLLHSTSSSSCGHSMPSWPCLCFSLFTLPVVVGHHSVSHLQTIWIPLLQSTISRCPAGLPWALSPVTLLPMFFPDGNWSYSCYVTRTSLQSLSCLGWRSSHVFWASSSNWDSSYNSTSLACQS